jgi:hypothetical protein
MPEERDSVLSPPASFKVTVGGEEYSVCECRPCDVPAIMEFAESVDAGELKRRLSLKAAEGGAALDMGSFLNFAKGKPGEVCKLLAAILDPDPLGPGSADWRAAAAARFMGLPVSQLTRALGKWMEVNASFFAEMAAPLIFGAAEFLKNVQAIVESRLELLRSSATGNA